jgi:hypothetical protein
MEGIRRGDDSAKLNRLDVNERIEGSSVEQLLTSRPSHMAHPSALDAAPPGYPHVRGGNFARWIARSTSTTWRECEWCGYCLKVVPFQEGCGPY